MTGFNHRFDPTVLREYDIRGIVGKTLNPEDAYAIGRCFGSVVSRTGGKRVAVGYDGRLHSPEMEAQLVAGLSACGLEVVRIGLCATPMLYYAAYALEADGAAMVTGSHNPPDYNGFKMMIGKKPFYGAQIQEIGRMAKAGDVVPEAAVLAREPLAPGDKSNKGAIVFCISSRKNFLEDFLLKWCQSQPLNQPLGH